MAWKFWSSSSVAKGSFNRRSRRRQALACTMEFLERRELLSASWTPLTNAAPGGIHTMMLLANGTVMGQLGGDVGWAVLTPNASGSYINGTWSTIASMHDTRQYYSSQVLQDGRVFIAGAEYGSGGSTAEVYNPITNTWTMTPQSPYGGFIDSISEILPNGNVMVAPVYANPSGTTAIYNPTSNTWSQGPLLYRGGDADEQSWVKLADGSILTIDSNSTSERYIPSLNQWINDGAVPDALYDGQGEIGAGVRLADGRAFYLGATGHTAIYTPTGTTAPGTWVAGPDIPGGLGTDDAPAAVLPDGTVLCAVGPSDTYNGPVTFFIYNPTTNAFSTVAGAPTSGVPYGDRMLDLPDGTVLMNNGGSTLYDYNPSVTPVAGVQPAINSVTQNADGSFHLTGTQLNGFSEGAYYGDDAQMNTNYPIVRLTSGSNVYYARTYNWSSTGVATGSTLETTEFRLPLGLPAGTYSLVVDGNGIASSVYSFTTAALNPAAPTVANAAAASQNPVTTTSVNLSVLGASTTGEANMFYSWAATTVPSGATAPTFSANGTYAAKNTTATFSAPGNYVFTATIYDTYGRTITSSVNVNVVQQATITIVPAAYTLAPNETVQYSASAVDQFGVSMPLTYTWSTTNGNITQAGLYTAPGSNGTGTVTASSGSFSASVPVNVHAALTWTGAGTNNNWSNAANWAGGVAPVAGDQLIFSGTTQTTTNNDFVAGTTFRSITFQSSNFILGGNSVTLTNLNGPIITNAGANTINFATAFSSASTIAANSGTLNLAGGLSGTTGLALTGTGSCNITQNGWLNSAITLGGTSLVLSTNGAWGGISQVISQTQASSVTIAGNNTFFLTGNNTYTGGTTINAGATLSLGNNTASGSVLGNITDNGSLTIYRSDANYAFTNNVSGTGSLYISGNVTATSNTINIGGDFRVAGNMTFTIQAGDAVTIGGHAWIAQLNTDVRSYINITGGSFTVAGALSDDRDSWFGITQSGGVVTLHSVLANQTSSGNGGGTVTNSIYILTGGQLITGNISGGGGTGSFNRGLDLELGGGTLTVSASFTMVADTVNLTGTNGNVTMDTGNFTVSSAYAFTGTGGLTKIGAGTLNLTANYTGATTVSTGTLNINSATTTSAVTVNGGTLNLNGVTTTGAVAVNGGIMNINRALTASGIVTVSGGTLNVNSALTTATLNIGAGTVHFANSGAASFNPNSISGLQVQLDASTLAAGAITTWNNADPAGNFTGGGTVQSGGANFSNKNVMHFNGSQTLVNTANFSSGAVTVMYVGSLDGTQNARLVSAVSNNWLLGFWGGDQNEAYFNGWVSNPGTAASTSSMIYEGTIDASGNAVAYNNGTVIGTGTGKQGPNGLSLGGNNGGDRGELARAARQIELLDIAAHQRGLDMPRPRREGSDDSLEAAEGRPDQACSSYRRSIGQLGMDDPLLDRAEMHHWFGQLLAARGSIRRQSVDQLRVAHDLFAKGRTGRGTGPASGGERPGPTKGHHDKPGRIPVSSGAHRPGARRPRSW